MVEAQEESLHSSTWSPIRRTTLGVTRDLSVNWMFIAVNFRQYLIVVNRSSLGFALDTPLVWVSHNQRIDSS